MHGVCVDVASMAGATSHENEHAPTPPNPIPTRYQSVASMAGAIQIDVAHTCMQTYESALNIQPEKKNKLLYFV